MTDEQEIQHNPTLDERVAAYLSKRSQKLSRRGAMVTVGRTLLRLSGLAFIPLLPSVGCTHGGTCNWTTCGMCGAFCSTSCCSGSGGVSRCPNCTTVGGSWTGCCFDPSTGCCSAGFMFSYTDCLSSNPSVVSACRDSTGCDTPPTGNCAQQGRIAYGAGYVCTTVTQGGPCNACSGPGSPY